jgi:hypothetical protein
VIFPSSLRDDQRTKAFAFSTKCLVQPSLCKTATDILPGMWQLDLDVGPDLTLTGQMDFTSQVMRHICVKRRIQCLSRA